MGYRGPPNKSGPTGWPVLLDNSLKMPYKSLPMGSLKLSIHRPRLISELSRKLSRYGVVFINAPAGFGKSTLIDQFLNSGFHGYFRYTVTSADRDPGVMLTSLSRRIPYTSPNARQRIGHTCSSNDSAITWQSECADILTAISSECRNTFVLALDDCHAARHSIEFSNLLAFLIQKRPSNVFLLLSGRNHPGSGLSRHLLHDEIGLIKHTELQFTAEEIRQLFSERYFADISRQQTREIKNMCGGWPLGVHLMAQYLSWQNLYADAGNMELPANHDFMNYLATEVIKELPADEKHFLMHTAIFEKFDEEMCGEILEEKNAGQKMENLFEKGLLLHIKESSDFCYSHNGMFRGFFRNLLKESIPPEELSKLHEVAGLYFASRCLPLEAIDHYLRGHIYDKAASVLEQNLKHLVSGTTALRMNQVIDSFPCDYTNDTPILFLVQGWALFLLGDWRHSMSCLQKALSLAEKEGYPHLLVPGIRLIAGIYYALGECGNLESFYKKWERKIPADHLARPEILCLLALAISQAGRMEQASVVWKQLQNLRIVREDSRAAVNIHTVRIINNALLHGRIREMDQTVQNALNDMKKSAPGLHARTSGYLAAIKYIQGFFGQCSDAVSTAVSDCKETNQIFGVNPLLLLKAVNSIDSGRLDTAKQALEMSCKNIAKQPIPPVRARAGIWKEYLFYLARAGLAIEDGNTPRFLHYADTAIKKVRREEKFPDIYVVYTFLAPRLARVGEPETAKQLLEDLDALLKPIDTPYFKAHTRLLLAFLHNEQDRKTKAATWLEKAVDTAKEHYYDFLFLYKEPEAAAKLCPVLLNQEKNFDFIANILIRLAPKGCDALCELLKTARPEKKVCILNALAGNACHSAEKKILPSTRDKNPEVRRSAKAAVNILRSLPPLPLTVQTLGTFMLKIGERQVQPGDWKRKMAISIFLYFLIHKDKPVTLEKLIDVFMPDRDPERAAAHIQTLVSSLRRILEPGIPPKRMSKYIKSEKGIYVFMLPGNSHVDAFEFDRLLSAGRYYKKKGDHYKAFNTCKEAYDLYNGDFLSGFPYYEWAESYRRRYSEQYDKLLFELAGQYLLRRQYTGCENLLQTLLSRDPLEEQAYLLLMQCRAARGNRPKAVKTYLQCRDILQKELNISPGNDLYQLYRNLLSTP